MEDSEILALYFRREQAAIDETAKEYGPRCFRVAENILASVPDAEECVNDALMRAWNAIPPARPQRLGVWLARVTRNLAFDRCKTPIGKSAAARSRFWRKSLSQPIGLSRMVNGVTVAMDFSAAGERIFAVLIRVEGVDDALGEIFTEENGNTIHVSLTLGDLIHDRTPLGLTVSRDKEVVHDIVTAAEGEVAAVLSDGTEIGRAGAMSQGREDGSRNCCIRRRLPLDLEDVAAIRIGDTRIPVPKE